MVVEGMERQQELAVFNTILSSEWSDKQRIH